jgi:hypothetical protein
VNNQSRQIGVADLKRMPRIGTVRHLFALMTPNNSALADGVTASVIKPIDAVELAIKQVELQLKQRELLTRDARSESTHC